ncbi:hypothetical protein EJ110_NYTH45225 [Nymphaea thermarum]|nr:hypothetical protein EJ110_NYTH45225 [Nymphaea thermarum]
MSVMLHSIFLHLRKIRRMSGVRDGKMRVVQLEWVFNWLAFFTARLGCHVLITYKLIRDAHKFERGVALPLALTGMAGMNLLNFFLGRDLLKAYRREQAQETHHTTQTQSERETYQGLKASDIQPAMTPVLPVRR